MNKSVIVYGPQGCGKSKQAAQLAAMYGLRTTADEWWPGSKTQATGVLYLTHWQPTRPGESLVVPGVRAIPFDVAMRDLQHAQ